MLSVFKRYLLNLFLLLLKICIYCVARKELLGLAYQLLKVMWKCAFSLRCKAGSLGLWFDHAQVTSETARGKSGVQLWHFPSQWVVSATKKEFLLPGGYYSHQYALLCKRNTSCVRQVQTHWKKSGSKAGLSRLRTEAGVWVRKTGVYGFRSKKEYSHLTCKVTVP